jgi:hypothetical protein
MVVRVHPAASLAALAVAAWPFSTHAQEGPTPSIGCTTPATNSLAFLAPSTVNGISWGDGLTLGAPTVLVDTLPAVQFDCGANMFGVPLQGSTFAVDFGQVGTVPGTEWKWDVAATEYKEFKFDVEYKVTEFDISGNAYKLNSDGVPVFDHKDFIGFKYHSLFGDSQFTNPDNPIFIDEISHKLILDPTIPGGSGFLELITTPGAPTPEPATFALFGSGLLAAARVFRRKSRR